MRALAHHVGGHFLLERAEHALRLAGNALLFQIGDRGNQLVGRGQDAPGRLDFLPGIVDELGHGAAEQHGLLFKVHAEDDLVLEGQKRRRHHGGHGSKHGDDLARKAAHLEGGSLRNEMHHAGLLRHHVEGIGIGIAPGLQHVGFLGGDGEGLFRQELIDDGKVAPHLGGDLALVFLVHEAAARIDHGRGHAPLAVRVVGKRVEGGKEQLAVLLAQDHVMPPDGQHA